MLFSRKSTPEVFGAIIFKFNSICVRFTFAGRAYWKGRSQISTNKLGLPSTDGIDQNAKPT
jgi:hypothetical protein